MACFHYYDSLPSTMDEARKHVLKGAEEGTVVIAAHQTAGRGRRGRFWESSPGNIYLTYITYQNCSLLEGAQLSFVACVAIGEALRFFLSPGHSLLYKWPNDLLLNGKKVGGILLEVFTSSQREEQAYLIGCGVNLREAPAVTRYPATAFQKEGLFLTYEEALEKIATSFQRHISLWQKEGFSPIHKLWMNFMMGRERPLSLDLEGKHYEGFCRGINAEGALILETSEGVITLAVGEVLQESFPHQYAFAHA